MSDISETPTRGSWEAMADECLDAPAFHRNQTAITDVLRRLLGDRTGNVIEIGSGTGRHVITFAAALPNLTRWPSDPDPAHRACIDAWRAERGPANVKPSVDLDAAVSDWRLGQQGRPPDQKINAPAQPEDTVAPTLVKFPAAPSKHRLTLVPCDRNGIGGHHHIYGAKNNWGMLEWTGTFRSRW